MSTTSLQVATFHSGYKPVPSSVPGWDRHRQATWPATTATLISADGRAVLVDALMTTTEGEQLGRWVRKSGDELTHIFLTHAHADHFFGATTVLRHHPAANLVSLPVVAEAARTQVDGSVLAGWNSLFPGQIADDLRVPEPMTTAALTLGAQELRTLDVGPSDTASSSVVHIPELDIVVCGDVAYNGMHMWLAGSTVATRMLWLRTLDTIETLQPSRMIVGHQGPGASDEQATRILDESRQYLLDFHLAAAACDSAQDLISAVLVKHRDLGNPYSLWLSAHDQPELFGGNG